MDNVKLMLLPCSLSLSVSCDVGIYFPTDALMGKTLSEESNSSCSKCGIIRKTDKLSCCARGGAWFENCGDVWESQFDHTWAEGMLACKNLKSTVMLRRAGFIDQSRYISITINITAQQQTNIYHFDDLRNTDDADSNGSITFVKAVVCIHILSTITLL